MNVSLVIWQLSLTLIVSSCIVIGDVQIKNISSSVAGEGGPIIPKPQFNSLTNNATHKNDSSHLERADLAMTKFPEYEVSKKNDNKTSVPKKSPVFPDIKAEIKKINSTTYNETKTTTKTSTTTTTKPTTNSTITRTTKKPTEVHKPTMTLGEDEVPLNYDLKKKNDTQNHGIRIESLTEKTKKTDYVVPIVAVILSVPIVAIVISVLYKRTADWWQHRHYRRMDFLIDGMYNN